MIATTPRNPHTAGPAVAAAFASGEGWAAPRVRRAGARGERED